MSAIKSLIVSIVAFAFVGTANAQTTNYWVNNGGYSGTFNDGTASGHWDPTQGGPGGGAAPTTNDIVVFNNNQTSPYTVGFSGDYQSSVFQVPADNVVFDLSGYTWTTRLSGFGNPPFNYGDGSRIGVGTGVTGTVTVSSSVAGANLVRDFISPVDFSYYALLVGYGAGSLGNLNINDSLGSPVTYWHRGNMFVGEGYSGGKGSVTVSGPGAEFISDYGGEMNINSGGTLTVTNGGKFTVSQLFRFGISPGTAYATVESGGTINSGYNQYGVHDPTVLNVKSGGTWNATTVEMGLFHFYTPAPIEVLLTVDGIGSSYNANNVIVGSLFAGQSGNVAILLKNGGTMTVSNSMLINPTTVGGEIQDSITLDSGYLKIGGGGTVTNRGVIRGVGEISRFGAATPYTLTIGSQGEIRPGDTTTNPVIGMLSVTDGNLIEEAGGMLAFDLSAPGTGDFIAITNGTATLYGYQAFNFIGYTPQFGERWELMSADSITYGGGDNLGTVLQPFGFEKDYSIYVDHRLGYDVLILYIPEPTTVSLLALGGWMLLRRRKS